MKPVITRRSVAGDTRDLHVCVVDALAASTTLPTGFGFEFHTGHYVLANYIRLFGVRTCRVIFKLSMEPATIGK